MAVKARWPGRGSMAQQTGDPFEDVPENDGSQEQDPYEQLRRLMDAETALLNRGVSCMVRDRPDTSCCACPKRGRIKELQALCDVGSQQERIVTELSCARIFDAEMPKGA